MLRAGHTRSRVALGLSMITKVQYLPIALGALALVLVVDLVLLDRSHVKAIAVVAVVSVGLLVGWWACQRAYYGADLFAENIGKLRSLAQSTSGPDIRNIQSALAFVVGRQSGHFHYFWGVPGLMYLLLIGAKRMPIGFMMCALAAFGWVGIAYFVLWTIPWPNYLLPAGAVAAIGVGKLWRDISCASLDALPAAWADIWRSRFGQGVQAATSTASTLTVGGMCTSLMLFGLVSFDLARAVRTNVLSADSAPAEAASFLQRTVPPDAIVETWERELDVLADLRYHFPDQSLLARTHAAAYRDGPKDYALGHQYFAQHDPQYLVIGWFARWLEIYDDAYLSEHATLVRTVGDGAYRYDIYLVEPGGAH
jgi:hypothetical protein